MSAIDTLREDEIQALIVLVELADPAETPNNNFYRVHPATVAEARSYFRRFAVDLSAAHSDLAAKGYLSGEADAAKLTPRGLELARETRVLRPPIWYWYKDFYAAIEGSTAFSTYCRRVFGRDMSQHGFADMVQVDLLLDSLALGPSSRVLDIGCGNGGIAEYLSDRTGAHVTGIDYSPQAVAQALDRTRAKAGRLRFLAGNIDGIEELALPAGSFDAVTSIDSIFFGRSLELTLRKLAALLAPGGRMGILCGCDLSGPLGTLGLAYRERALDREHFEHMRRKREVAAELRPLFERESIEFVWQNLMTESAGPEAVFGADPRASFRRLYLVLAG